MPAVTYIQTCIPKMLIPSTRVRDIRVAKKKALIGFVK
jgi:hypothetical protein